MVVISNIHSDIIHDTVLDYYGRKLATCSSDKTIKIYEIDGDSHKLLTTLTGHEGPVWRIDWAHPKFGTILASCSYDGKVIIWKEENGTWSQIAVHSVHSASVNSVKWAPHEYGAVLLAASSDGKISVVEFKENGTQNPMVLDAHAVGVNSAAWAPATIQSPKNPTEKPLPLRRFVTGGADNLVKIWKFDQAANTYILEDTLEGHSDWVRDVTWSPSVLLGSCIASVSQDRTCIIWTQSGNEGVWRKTSLQQERFPDVLWRASWSLSGNVLALSGGDNRITLWKENLQGGWEQAGVVAQ
ncbi:hypothetical protein TBLA_0F02400 [Henningerozyma blattae CBS 6284]|uniref:Uncharacterized protein n=1 Tax=Henningerozyma blattae (strain ATCC 34711 / CBS 6284 / DSM 70876 / NBRC 10599 / NRRL Y-10934 / UCD 77-7) TaxID=1071380 RepID=I2H5X8_HENB6|nr:hypothetical protein TBLA_0F02400 [Tetrapisispora blattae CBS 6284]CCH61780.1 hypothetical protein TBLA_0F02400 [Tetrapisispora blattae CBS 6284]